MPLSFAQASLVKNALFASITSVHERLLGGNQEKRLLGDVYGSCEDCPRIICLKTPVSR
jgi:hypothetical protein